MQFNNKETNEKIWLKNRRRIWLNIFSEEYIQMVNRHMKRCSASLTIREMQIKTVRHHITSTRKVKAKKTGNNKCCWGRGEPGPLLHDWWECKIDAVTLENSLVVPQKAKYWVTIWASNPRYTPKKIKNYVHTKLVQKHSQQHYSW